MKIGFLGLGAMGSGMASNLLKAGHQVTVWNRSPEPAQALAARGAAIALEPAGAMAGDIALSILANDEAVLSVFSDAVLSRAAPGLVHANMATVSIDAVRAMNAAHTKHGVGFAGAPVFGRPDAAAAGKLNIVVSGDPAFIAKLQPAFDCMAQKTWALGSDPVEAHVVKIAGNLMIMSVIEMLSEALALCENCGVDPKKFAEIMTNSIFSAPVFRSYAALISEKTFEPAAFSMHLGLKDAGLALAAGRQSGTPLPLVELIRAHFLEGIAHGDGDKDWSALARVIARKSTLRQ